MSINIIRVIIGCLLFFSIPVHANPARPLPIQHWETTNGARVFFIAIPHLPIVDIQVVFSAGSARDGKQFGLANMANNMLGEATPNLDTDQIAARFENVGAKFSNGTSRDMAAVSLRSMTDPAMLQPALQTFVEILTKPLFPEKNLQRLQKQAVNALKAQDQSPSAIAANRFFSTIYGDYPYGHSVLGKVETVTALDAQQLKKFYQQYYVAKNAVIAIVGAVNETEAKKIADQISQGLATGNAAPPLPLATPVTNTTRLQQIQYAANQTHIILGQLGITHHDPDYYAMRIANHILGGGMLTSRLAKKVREQRGLAYDVTSVLEQYAGRGVFLINLQTRTDQAMNALKITEKALQDYVAQGPSAEEVNLAKQDITGSFAMALDNNQTILQVITLMGYYRLPLDYLANFKARINAVTLAQIQAALKRHIHPDQFVTVLVGNNTQSNDH